MATLQSDSYYSNPNYIRDSVIIYVCIPAILYTLFAQPILKWDKIILIISNAHRCEDSLESNDLVL